MKKNPVVHFEIPFDDEDRAKTFYSAAFGWHISDWPIEDGSTYTGVMTGEVGEDGKHTEKAVIGGGMVPRAQLQSPVLMLNTENVDEVTDRAVTLGGEKLSEHTYVGIGRVVYIKDTEGNVVGLWEENKKVQENA